MKVFRDLYLNLSVDRTEVFFSEVEQNLVVDWSRDHDAEKRTAREFRDKYFYYFTCKKTKKLEAALVALTRKNDTIVYIANIVPRELGKLSKDQYNTIVLDFYNRCLKAIM